LDPPEIKEILEYKESLEIIDFIKFVFYIIILIFVFILRRDIIKQEEQSPLISIDHFLNEALYKNIIQQSQNPDDQNLHKEYNVIYSMSKKSNFASLFNENDMDNTDENINNINNNLRTI
jgi:hypothetical protein